MNDMSGGFDPQESQDPTDVTLTQDDVARAAQRYQMQQRVLLNNGLDGDPDKAASAIDLSNTTGDPADYIYQNQDDYTARTRQAAAQGLVLDNPALLTYMQSHPLAATVSGDDWGNLAKFTRESQGGFFKSLSDYTPQNIKDLASVLTGASVGAVKGGWEGLTAGGAPGEMSSEWASELYDPERQRLGWAGVKTLFGPAEAIVRGLNAIAGATVGAAKGAGEGLEGSPMGAVAKDLLRRMSGGVEPENLGEVAAQGAQTLLENPLIVEGALPHGEGAAPAAEPGLRGKVEYEPSSGAEAATPWFAAGEEPPTGLHPDIDKVKAETNAAYQEHLDTDLQNALATATRERSPELFRRLTGEMYGDARIGISGDAALALYGDKAPTADDGILGWVPNIENQLALARDSGTDISVPLADWVAKVDPEVAKGLHDDMRMWPGGITKNEAGEAAERAPPVPAGTGVVDDVRAAAGLEPGPETAAAPEVQRAMAQRAEADQAASEALESSIAAQRKTQTWRDNRAEMVKGVAAEMRQRPDIAADALLDRGEMYGKEAQGSVKLRADALTPEQRAALPERYVAEDGVDPEALAPVFGYQTGAELVDRVAALQGLKVDEEGNPVRDWERRMVQAETDRRMEMAYGKTPEKILEAAKDLALSDAGVKAKYEDYAAQAQAAGVQPIDQKALRAAAKNAIQTKEIGSLSSFGLMENMGRHARRAEAAFQAGKAEEAVGHMQKQMMNLFLAREARGVEKAVQKLNTDAPRWGKFDFGRSGSSVFPHFANVIQQVLLQIGKHVEASPEYLAKEMRESGWGTDVRTFVNDRIARTGEIIEPWEEMYDPSVRREFNALSVTDFSKADAMLRTLVHAAREEKKVYSKGGAVDFETKVKPGLLAGILRLKELKDSAEAEVTAGRLGREAATAIIQPEAFVDRLDRWDWKGPWNQYWYRPMKDADNIEAARVKEITKGIQDVITKSLPKGTVTNTIFRNPRTGKLLTTPREALWSAMLNQGNADNIVRFAEGWGLKPEEVRAWIDANATKADWDGVQQIWDLLKKTGNWSDMEYRSIADRPMQQIAAQTVDTPHGQYAGGYYPDIYHPEFPGSSYALLGIDNKALFHEGYSTGFTPGAGYRMGRTDYRAPMALTLDALPQTIMEQIHDGAFRGSLIQAMKILRDKDIRNAMYEHGGKELYDLFTKFVMRAANNRAVNPTASAFIHRAAGFARFFIRNTISNLIGFNVGTVEKHGLSALVGSVRAIGPNYFLKAMAQLTTGTEVEGIGIHKWLHDNFQEVARRDRHWMENLYGATEYLHNRNSVMNKFYRFRDWTQWAASKPVAISDMVSTKPLALGAYLKALDNGESHGDAIAYAEKLIREYHGSTSITSKPLIMTDLTQGLVPMYNYYNTVLSRLAENYWRAGDAMRAFKEGDEERFKVQVKHVAAGMFVSAFWPALVHNLIDPPEKHPNDNKFIRGIRYVVHPASGLFPLMGNFTNYLFGTTSPDIGIYSEAAKAIGQLPKEALSHHAPGYAHTRKLFEEGGTFLGEFGVGGGRQIGRWAGTAYGALHGQEHVRTPMDLQHIIRYGTAQQRRTQ